jgi:hypothetical protein
MRSSMWFYGIAASKTHQRAKSAERSLLQETMQRNERAHAMRMRKQMEATRGQRVLDVWRKLRQSESKHSVGHVFRCVRTVGRDMPRIVASVAGGTLVASGAFTRDMPELVAIVASLATWTATTSASTRGAASSVFAVDDTLATRLRALT